MMQTFIYSIGSAGILYSFLKLATPQFIENPVGVFLTILIPFLFPQFTPSPRKTALAQFCASLVLGTALPGYLFGDKPEFSRTITVFIFSSVTLICILLYQFSTRLKEYLTQKISWDFVLYTTCFLYGVSFAIFGCYLYSQFQIGIGETGDFLQAIGSAVQGRFFETPSLQYPTLFAYHNHVALFFLVPFYKIFPTPFSIYILRSFLIALSAIPLFWLSKKNLDKPASFLIVMAFLTAPYLISMHVEETVLEPFVFIFIFLSFYFFEKEKFFWFLVCFLMSLTPKEDLSLSLGFFSIYALIRKRKLFWCYVPGIIAITWFLISELVVIPFFTGEQDQWILRKYYGVFGNNLKEIIIGMISNPMLVFKTIFNFKKIQFFWIVLSSMGFFVPFLTSIGLFILPSLLKVALSGKFITETGSVHSEIRPWYGTPTIVFGFVALSYALGKLLQKRNNNNTRYFIHIFLFLQVMINVTSYPYWTYSCRKGQEGNFPKEYVSSLNKIVQLVPKEASIVGPRYLVSSFHESRRYYDYPFAKQGFDYIILDERNSPRLPQEKIRELKEEMLRGRQHELLFSYKEISVYGRQKMVNLTH